MEADLEPGEAVVKHGAANVQRGIEAVGGRLWLTDRRLYFKAHRLNVQTGVTSIPLSEVDHVEKGWTRFLGVVPLAPNSLVVHLRDGTEHRFVLAGRTKWAEAIGAQH